MNLKMRNATLILGLATLILSFQNCSGVGFDEASSLSEKSADAQDDSGQSDIPDVSDDDSDGSEEEPKNPVAYDPKGAADFSHVMGELVVCEGVVTHISHVHPKGVVYLVNSRLDDVSHIHYGGRVVVINGKAPKNPRIVAGKLTDDLLKKCGREKLKSAKPSLYIAHATASESISADRVEIAHVHKQDDIPIDMTVRAPSLHISHIHETARVVWLAK